ncbi:MAG: SMC family ATPase [Oscillospiraceae bacterium]|nr:SMC family ATPase [Oscillospiraceae bacterium]
MRPLSLEMTAFGSYAETTCVPFEQLRHGLYLVAGDTGAGKTTIFDAVVFALFGRPSGKDRSVDMLHCDYVEKSVDTVVKLRFEQGGKEYTVLRSIHFPKKRGEERTFGDQQIAATLLEPDRNPTEGAGNVTRRVEELLGLNADQFCKIVMLAQGEFREFLKADSDRKNEILGKLFDNSSYLRYQNLLSGARDELGRRRSARSEELRQLMQGAFRRPEGMTEEEALGFLPSNPVLLENLSALVQREDQRLRELSEERERLRQQISALDSRKGAAEALNAQFEALEKTERELEELLGRTEEMERRKLRLERSETAYHQVRPFLEEQERAERSLRQSLAELQQRRREAEEAAAGLEKARKAAEEDPEKEQRLAELELLLQLTAKELTALQELDKKRGELLELSAQVQEAERRQTALEQDCAQKQALLLALRGRLEELESAGALALQRKGEYERAREREDALAELRRELEQIRLSRQELEKEGETLNALTAAALAAEGEYHRLYRRFLAGQAGLMARDLRQEIGEKGEAACPVCGSRVDSASLERFAPLEEDMPDQTRVDGARERMNKAERERAEQDKRRERLSARLQSQKETALQEAVKLLPGCESWEQLEDGRLAAESGESRRRTTEALAAMQTAQALEQERLGLREELPEKEQALRTAEENREALRDRLQELRSRESAMRTLVREKAAELSYPGAAEARAAQVRMQTEQTGLRRALELSRAALETARTRRDTALGGLREKEELTRTREQERQEAGLALELALQKTGFADVQAVRAALPPAQERDPLSWLRMEGQRCSDWANDCANKRRQAEEQRQRLAGKEPVETAALLLELEEAGAEAARCAEAWGRQENLLANHRQVLTRAAEAKEELRRSDRAWERLERLGSLAAGVNSETGRLSFDRYVMGAVFREILEMANRRMDVMSGGRYQLIHRSGADRRNARAGLEIQVLDLSTGQLRSSESLSGGEGFFTSLALALGLADTVQNRSGGRRLDALFIDEGFGSLSGGVLDKALEVLNQLSEGRRLVGVISHVDQLEESIPQKIRVRSGPRGSSLRLELA